MILVDTSIWVDHLNHGDDRLISALSRTQVLSHPFVLGEIALGNLRQRDLVLGEMRNLPKAVVASDTEVLDLIAHHRLFGLGIGYVDAHLLAATLLTAGSSLWTRDKRLDAVAKTIGVSADFE
ncbi:type II toxin-antitoxin system VapC family toxin [Mesorhizobium sp. CAU 1732]|uniref:type II toxin-antitoxin system VapC family toxin n=1 Tax=Mesorhizobium sp. CAU 1732 TaxID=3140358 RepID=UPI003260B194